MLSLDLYDEHPTFINHKTRNTFPRPRNVLTDRGNRLMQK